MKLSSTNIQTEDAEAEAEARHLPVNSRSAVWCGAIAAFLLIYVLVYPLVPIALKTSGLGQRLPEWVETGFKLSASPLIFAHKNIPIYRGYVKFLGNLVGEG
jgi:hypothetical protein